MNETRSQSTLDRLIEAASAKCITGGHVIHVSRDELLTAIGEIRRLRQAMKAADQNGDSIGMRVILREALQKQ